MLISSLGTILSSTAFITASLSIFVSALYHFLSNFLVGIFPLSAIRWDVTPEMFSVGSVTIRWYGLLFSSGFFLGYILMSRMFMREYRPVSDMEPLTFTMIAGTIIGMRLGHCLFYQPDYYLANPLEILQIWKGGYASHGAVVGISAALWFYSRNRPEQPFLWIIDRIAIVTALAAILIRVGNFFNHEMIGHATDLPWAVIFTQRDLLPRHPSQLYEALCYAFTFLLMRFIYNRYDARTPNGLLLGVFFICIFGARFAVEFTKENQVAFENGLPLNMGQILSVPLVILGAFLVWRARTNPVVTLPKSMSASAASQNKPQQKNSYQTSKAKKAKRS